MWAQLYVGLIATFMLLCLSPASCSLQGEKKEPVPLGVVMEGEERCVRKVVMEARTVRDEVVECSHKYRRRCHTTYITEYTSHQEEECKELYIKECYISFSPSLSRHPVEVCTQTLSKNCSVKAAPVCQTESITSCSTMQEYHQVSETRPQCRVEQHTVGCTGDQGPPCPRVPVTRCTLVTANVTKATPRTSCSRTPTRVCGPGPCPLVRGGVECRRETRGVLQQVPIEECTLTVRPDCRLVTRLVPRLKPKQECLDVPHEVCVRVQRNPRKELRPVIKFWCFKPKPPKAGSPPPQTRLVLHRTGPAALYSTGQYSALQYTTEQYSALQYSTQQDTTVLDSTLEDSTLEHSTLKDSTLEDSTLEDNIVQSSTEQYGTVVQ